MPVLWPNVVLPPGAMHSKFAASSTNYPLPVPIPVSGSRPKTQTIPVPPKPWFPQPKWVHTAARNRQGFATGVTKHPSRANLNEPTPGLPPPPPYALGNEQLIALHAARYVRERDMAMRPERNAVMLNGRPWTVLIKTHEGAPAWEWFFIHV